MDKIMEMLKNFTNNKKWRIAIWAALLLFLLALPIQMGEKANKHIPGLHQIEEVARSYCVEQLPKIAAATAITYAVSGVISVLEELRFSAVVVSIAPGKALSSINDTIKSLGKALMICTVLFVLGTTIIDMITLICFKLLIPGALILQILHECHTKKFAWAKDVAKPLATGAILLWLYFPATALIGNYIQNTYLDGRIAAEMQAMEADKTGLGAIREEAIQAKQSLTQENASATADSKATQKTASAADPQNQGWISRAGAYVGDATRSAASALNPSAYIDKLNEKIKAAINLAENLVIRMIWVVVMFIMTAVVIPVGMLILFIKIFKSLNAPRSQYPPTQKEPLLVAGNS